TPKLSSRHMNWSITSAIGLSLTDRFQPAAFPGVARAVRWPDVPYVIMYLDVVDLRAFYGERLGLVARRLICRQLKARWPSVAGESLVGIGYATPCLGRLGEGAERVMAFMPASQGVVNWPREGPNATALVAEDCLPLPDASVDRVLVIHSLEVAGDASEQLR